MLNSVPGTTGYVLVSYFDKGTAVGNSDGRGVVGDVDGVDVGNAGVVVGDADGEFVGGSVVGDTDGGIVGGFVGDVVCDDGDAVAVFLQFKKKHQHIFRHTWKRWRKTWCFGC